MRVFGADNVPPVSSTKSFTGHTTSAAGSVESVISILAMLNDFLPVNLNFKNPMEMLSFRPVTDEKPLRPIRHVMTNSFGFGGNDTTCIFSKNIKVMSVYIRAAAQISVQNPLCDDWLENPVSYDVPFQRSIEANYKRFTDPVSSRRMGKILKRAIATSLTVVEASGIHNPDAIIVGTGLGCLETTENF